MSYCIKKFEESWVIQDYKAIVNLNKLRRVIKSFINIALPSDFTESAHKDNRIIECNHIVSEDCLLLKVTVKNMYKLKRVIGKTKA